MEINELIGIFSELAFFKERKDITASDFRELVTLFEMRSVKAGENIVTYGDNSDHFYLIITGQCSVSIPNPAIRGWADRHRHYQDLRNWYARKIIPKIAKAKRAYIEYHQNKN